MRLIENRTARGIYLVLLLFTLLAGDAWRYTIGWAGWGVFVGLLAAASVTLLIVQRHRWTFKSLPFPLLGFMVLTALSIAWSFYPGASALGVTTTWLTVVTGVAVAVTYSWAEILRALGVALRFVLGLSLLFELVVSTIIRHPVLPPVAEPGIDYSNLPNPIPPMLFWSRNELFASGKIQGIAGNSTLLSFVALVGIIVFGLQLFEKTRREPAIIFWLVVAALCFVLTRSATNFIGFVAVAVVAVAVLLVRRAAGATARRLTYGGIIMALLAAVVGALVFSKEVLAFLGKSSDLTNRAEIWHSVIQLATQRPAFGWGWVSYWVPWVAPFDHLAENNGVRQLHAHNAWLDVWFQLGIIGLVIFGALVLSTLSRSWWFAVDRPRLSPRTFGTFATESLLPLLVLVALLVQSLAESRLLVEFGMLFLAVIAVKTKRDERETRAGNLEPLRDERYV